MAHRSLIALVIASVLWSCTGGGSPSHPHAVVDGHTPSTPATASASGASHDNSNDKGAALRQAADAAIDTERLIAWRRHFHQFPQLSNREVKTAAYIADRLREMGLSPKTGIAATGSSR
jgi:hypothetical protein